MQNLFKNFGIYGCGLLSYAFLRVTYILHYQLTLIAKFQVFHGCLSVMYKLYFKYKYALLGNMHL